MSFVDRPPSLRVPLSPALAPCPRPLSLCRFFVFYGDFRGFFTTSAFRAGVNVSVACPLPSASCGLPQVLSDRSTLRVPRLPALLTSSPCPPCHEEGKSSVREGRNRLKPFALRFDLGLPTGGRQRLHDRAAASASSHGENELRSRLDVAIWRRWSGPGTHFRNRGGTTVRTVRITHLVNANVSLTSGYVVCWCGQSSLFQLSATVRNCPQLSATVRNCPH